MPLKDDFIQRTLEQLAEVVRALAGLQQPEDVTEAERFIEGIYRQHTGSEAALLRRLSSEQLLQVLSSAGVLDREKAFLLAGLNEAEAALIEAKGEAGASAAQVKAFDLYLEAALAELDVSELHDHVRRLRLSLDAYVLPEATEWRWFSYLAQQGHYAQAEDQLFELLARLGPTAEVAARGRRFYQGLEHQPDAKLSAGNLPRGEVREGRAAFEAQLSGSALD